MSSTRTMTDMPSADHSFSFSGRASRPFRGPEYLPDGFHYLPIGRAPVGGVLVIENTHSSRSVRLCRRGEKEPKVRQRMRVGIAGFFPCAPARILMMGARA